MFGISLTELLIILGIAIFVVKPKDLPEIANYFGKIYAKIKKSINYLKTEFEKSQKEIGIDQIKQEFKLGIDEEEKKDEESQEIVDIYGNIHKVSKISDLRTDLTKEELEEEIRKYNELNKSQNINKNIKE